MLKENTLKKNHEFQSVIRKGNSKFSNFVVLYQSKNKTKKIRFGISVSKKFLNAVGRNRIKRQVRSIIDSLEILNEQSKDIIIIVRKPFINSDFNKKSKELTKMLEGLNVVRRKIK